MTGDVFRLARNDRRTDFGCIGMRRGWIDERSAVVNLREVPLSFRAERRALKGTAGRGAKNPGREPPGNEIRLLKVTYGH